MQSSHSAGGCVAGEMSGCKEQTMNPVQPLFSQKHVHFSPRFHTHEVAAVLGSL